MADVSITPANFNVVSNTPSVRVQFGEAVTPGQPVYLKTSDRKYWLADCDALATANLSGISESYAEADGYGNIVATDSAVIDVGATLADGEIYVVSDTAGNIMPNTDLTSGQYVSLVGVGNGDGNLLALFKATGITHA